MDTPEDPVQVRSNSPYKTAAGAHMRPKLLVHAIFERHAKSTPDAIALLSEDSRLTYKELNQRANQLARYLRSRGATGGIPIGMCLGRSFEAVIAMLAIAKAGGAYVPLDPDYPDERLNFMLGDIRAPLAVTEAALADRIEGRGADLVLIDSDRGAIDSQETGNLGISISPESLIYVMYTSGSSGRPKGVMIEHRSIVRLVEDCNYVSLDATERCLMLAPVSFDASTFEIWGALLNGASLVVAPRRTLSLKDIGRLIERFGVTTLWLTAGLFNLMIDQEPRGLTPLRQLLTGGDAGSSAHFRRALERLPGVRLINGYGPTESTTFAACATVTLRDLSAGPVPIGFPVRDTQIWVLDERMNPVPWGTAGELFIGGEGLMRGYLNRPDLDLARLAPPPWAPFASMRLYRTGDLARYREDGALEMLGRVDDQVKIAGHRVEPDETAFWLREHPAVRDAVVIAEKGTNGVPRLVAYMTLRGNRAPASSELRAFLLSKLPDFMVPAKFAIVDAIALNPNGKVDRERLAAVQSRSGSGEESAVPAGDLQAAIGNVWKEVLGVSQAGIHDNFFDLGGDSLKLIEVHSKLSKQLGEIDLMALFEYPTIAALSQHLRGKERRALDDIEARATRQKQRLDAQAASRTES